jgi:large subunit ribosomal protein L29
MTSAQDLRELNADDLRNRERDLYDQLFRLRVQKAMGQLDAPVKIRQVRRDLARVKTVLRQMATVPSGESPRSVHAAAGAPAGPSDEKS